PVECFVEFGVRKNAAVLVFDAPARDPPSISGRLGAIGSEAEIGVAELSPRAVYSGEFERLRRDGPHRALVILCAGERPGMGLLNAEQFRNPYGPPALHVASTERPAVFEAIAQRRPARLVSVSKRTSAVARNVVVTLRGTQRDRPPVVIMTPRSSWWQSTAERGGGLVCWLESLRAVLASPPRCDVIFTANSGHELGHLGLDDFIARRPGWEQPVAGGVGFGFISAPISAPSAAISRSSRRATICAPWPPPNSRAPAGQQNGSRQRHWCRAARRATSTAPAGAM